MIEIYDLREIREGFVARQAAKKIDRKELERMWKLCDSMECSRTKGDLEKYLNHDFKFHRLLGRISENSRLQKIVQSLRYQARMLMASSVQIPGRAKQSFRDHEEILPPWKPAMGLKLSVKSENITRDAKGAVLENYYGKGGDNGEESNSQLIEQLRQTENISKGG